MFGEPSADDLAKAVANIKLPPPPPSTTASKECNDGDDNDDWTDFQG